MAAGFSIPKEKFPELKNILENHFREKFKDHNFKKIINIDSALALKEIDHDLISSIEKLAPYGIGNPKPVFASGPLTVIETKLLGKDKAEADREHIKLKLEDSLGEIKTAIIWRKAQEFLQDLKEEPELKIL